MRRLVDIGIMALALLLAGCSLSGSSSDSARPAGGDGPTTSAGPSATSAPAEPGPATPDQPYDCAMVDASTWSVTPSDEDLVAMVGTGKAPGPDGAPTGRTAYGAEYPTPDDFLAQSNVPDKEERRQVMVDAGYAGGIEAQFGDDQTIQVLTFADVAGVEAYFAARLPNICSAGGARTVTPLSADGGIGWVDPRGAAHAEFFLGTSQVSLTLCACETTPPTVEAMQAWYRHWIERTAAGPAVPVV